MSARPGILGDRRWVGLAILVGLAFGQAVTMIVAAFATRAAFIHLRDGSGTEPPLAALAAIGLAGAALFVLRSLEGRVAERTGQGYAADIRKALFKHMTRMPTSEIARRRSGALALRYVGDLSAFKGWVSRGLARLISAAVTIPAAFLTLYLLEPLFFVGSSLPIIAVMICIFWMSGPLGEAHSDLRTRRARLAAAMAERLPQGIALRRSGRINTELKMLSRRSERIIDASVRRASLAATVRALPDAGSGFASAICLYICFYLGLGVPDAVAALTALALIIWPLRHLADVSDRRRAYVVASDKLDAMFAAPRMPHTKKAEPDPDALPVLIRGVQLPGVRPLDIALRPGEIRRLGGPEGCGKSTLLLMLAGFEQPAEAEGFHVLGVDPSAVPTGRVLYLGRHAPQLKGSLRREATIGIGRSPSDSEIEKALVAAGLGDLATRVGGLDGKIAEGRRNLTSSEQVRLHVARGLLSRARLALIDADEIGLDADALHTLLDHFADSHTAALVVTSDLSAGRHLEQVFEMQTQSVGQTSKCIAAE